MNYLSLEKNYESMIFIFNRLKPNIFTHNPLDIKNDVFKALSAAVLRTGIPSRFEENNLDLKPRVLFLSITDLDSQSHLVKFNS